jgi:hypothetical protein
MSIADASIILHVGPNICGNRAGKAKSLTEFSDQGETDSCAAFAGIKTSAEGSF